MKTPNLGVLEHPPEVTYPPKGFSLWTTDVPPEDRLRIINPEAFPKDQLLISLGLHSQLTSSFGITNVEEIINRQELVRFLIDRPDLIEWILKRKLPASLPNSGDTFIEFYDPILAHNPYWAFVYQLIGKLDIEGKLPKRLATFCETLRQSLSLEDAEKNMAAIVGEWLQGSAYIEGIVNISAAMTVKPTPEEESESEEAHKRPAEFEVRLDQESVDGTVFGYRKFSFKLSQAQVTPYPDWTQKKWLPWNWFGLGKLQKWMIDKENEENRQKAYKATIIDGLSDGLAADLIKGLRAVLNKVVWFQPLLDDVVIKFYFRYDKDGLSIRIYGIDHKYERSADRISFNFDRYDGYTDELNQRILAAKSHVKSTIQSDAYAIANAELRKRIIKVDPQLFSRTNDIPSPATDAEHRWFGLENIYRSEQVSPTYHALISHRQFVSNQFNLLTAVAEIARRYLELSAKTGFQICTPEILTNGESLIGFENIVPLQLLLQMQKDELPVPISGQVSVDGKMVALTGRHGEGKTVTAETIPLAVFLAQSGLPVLGKGFRFNVRKTLGMVSIVRGAGSTIQLYLEQIKKVLDAAQDCDGKTVLVVLDELGTGTQEQGGLRLGRGVLEYLFGRGISVIFTTQIGELAGFASANLGARCFRFRRGHQIESGIGGGEVDDLVHEVGLDQILGKSR